MIEPEPAPQPKGNAVWILLATVCTVFAVPYGYSMPRLMNP